MYKSEYIWFTFYEHSFQNTLLSTNHSVKGARPGLWFYFVDHVCMNEPIALFFFIYISIDWPFTSNGRLMWINRNETKLKFFRFSLKSEVIGPRILHPCVTARFVNNKSLRKPCLWKIKSNPFYNPEGWKKAKLSTYKK